MKSQTLLIALLTIMAMGSGLGVVYVHHVNRQQFIRLQTIQTARDGIDIEWELLQLEQSTLVTNIAIQQIARTRLNMRTPDPGEVLYIAP
ncbi:MAG: cell division protein FtsL [Candidatus Contendobacter sp.]|jgi:cell division protein FtsL|nr:cell division protein FtsL [Candidatus Contendobacter sp.]